MENTRIYTILSQLDKPMLNRFLKFIDSPYHNRNSKVSALTHLLINTIKSGEKLPEKEKIWEIILESNQYDDLKFRKLCNDVLERFENFLIIEQVGQNNLLTSNLLLLSIKNNNIEQLIEKHINKSSRLIDREFDQSSEFYLQKYFYQKTLQNLKTNYEKKANIKEFLSDYNYNDLSFNIDSFYAIEKLRHANDILTWRKLYKIDVKINLDFTIQLIERNDLQKNTAVHIYLLMYRILSGTTDDTLYYELKSLSTEKIDLFPNEERREIMDVLFNYCVNQINTGINNFYNELLELYDWGINSEIILVNGVLSPTSFRNYIVSGLRSGQFDRVENFIRNKSDLLEESRRENAIHYNLARVFFHKRKFEEALDYLSKVNYDDIWYQINSRIQLLAIYYELDEDMVLESQMDSFQAYLRREKSIQDSYQKLPLNFIKFLKRIYKAKPRDKESLKVLREQIENEPQVSNKPWLLEKIDELL